MHPLFGNQKKAMCQKLTNWSPNLFPLLPGHTPKRHFQPPLQSEPIVCLSSGRCAWVVGVGARLPAWSSRASCTRSSMLSLLCLEQRGPKSNLWGHVGGGGLTGRRDPVLSLYEIINWRAKPPPQVCPAHPLWCGVRDGPPDLKGVPGPDGRVGEAAVHTPRS